MDQRIRELEAVAAGFAGSGFLGWRDVCLMTDGSHHGEGEHNERHMPMPSVPGTGLVMVEAEFVLCGLEAVLDGPAMAFHSYQRFDKRPDRAPCRKESQIAIRDVRRISKPRVQQPDGLPS